MTGVDTIYTLVQDAVKRPDRQGQIWRRIHRSILAHHRIDQWKRDLVEQVLEFSVANTAAMQQNVPGVNGLFMNWFGSGNTTLNVQVIDTTLLTRFRKYSYIRKWMTVDPYGLAILDPITGLQGTVAGGDLTERNPDTMGDGYGYDIQDVFYQSGTDTKLNSSTPLSTVYIGYFSDPKVNLACATLEEFQEYESFIADDYPGLIVTDVTKYMYGQIGKMEAELKLAQAEYATELAIIQASLVRVSTK